MNKLANQDMLNQYLALKMLRENMYYSDPARYNSLDFLDDMPGKARQFAPYFQDVLPSRAMISSDETKRKAQIADAIRRIKASKSSNGELGKQIGGNMLSMGLGSIPISITLSTIGHLAGFRNPMGRLGGLGKQVTKSFKSPVTPIRQIKNLIKRPQVRNNFLKETGKDALVGAGIGATFGAAYPLIASRSNVSDKDIYSASQILEKHPYLSSLPVADIMSVVDNNKKLSRPSNIAIGTGIGASAGLVGAMTPSLVTAPYHLGKALLTRRLDPSFLKGIQQSFIHDVPRNVAFMGGTGAMAGALTDNIVKDNVSGV